MLPFPFAMRAPEVIPGNVSFTTVGTFEFTVPEFNTLTVTVRGGGGGGAGLGGQGSGQASSFGDVSATGGGTYNAPGTGVNGDQNYTGGLGGEAGALFGGHGGEGANGGGAATPLLSSNGNAGNAPGGGGAGSVVFYVGMAGGAGGGCAVKTYTGGLAPGSQVTVVVGAGGTISMGGGNGARGQVDISWN